MTYNNQLCVLGDSDHCHVHSNYNFVCDQHNRKRRAPVMQQSEIISFKMLFSCLISGVAKSRTKIQVTPFLHIYTRDFPDQKNLENYFYFRCQIFFFHLDPVHCQITLILVQSFQTKWRDNKTQYETINN